MNTGNQPGSSISKSVLGIVFVGIVLIGVAIWQGLAAHKKSTSPSATVVVTETAVATTTKPVVQPAPAVAAQADNGSLAVIPISLTNFLIEAENNVDSAMKTLPQGTQVYGGIEFWLQGVLHLQSQSTRGETYKNSRASILVPLTETNLTDGKLIVTERGKNIASIYFIGGTRFVSPQAGEKFADVVWHYSDGTLERSGLEYDVHLRDWSRTPYETPAQLPNALTRVAWHGPQPKRKNRTVRLYRVALVNPHPDKVIEAIEFTSAMTKPSLFICALTLDPLMPGARSDDLTSQEVADPELSGQLQLAVQDAAGHPLPGAVVTGSFHGTPLGSGSRKYTTDDNGLALVRYPDSDLESLEVSAEHDDFSGQKMLWDVKSGDTVPASYTLKLSGEVKIGGTVFDPDNNPVPGAKISIYRFWRGMDDSPNTKGEQPSFSNQTLTTDADGRWQAKGLPARLLQNIGFNITHPDYLTVSANLGDNATVEKQLRNFTYKTVLQRGLDVSGRVVDGGDNPVPGATVWAGRKYTSDRKQATTGDDGTFSIHTVPDGEVLFSVMAKGHSPANKTVVVQTNMPEIVFRLQAASVIRAHVQDESSQPVTGARVQLDGNYDSPSYAAYEFSGTTDANGDFTWDSAPAEPMSFYIYHDGFAAKRNVLLAPNQDNTIIMHPARKLSGVVLDASTGQPVTKFTVRTGKTEGDESNVYGVINDKSFTAADGKFTLSLNEEEDNAVAVNADDYAQKVEKITDAQDGTASVTVQLTASASLSGVVIAPDGTPAPDISVGVASETPRTSIQLSAGQLRTYDGVTKLAVTDAEGHFKVAVPGVDGTVVAAGDVGFASAPVDAVRNSGTITLQAWGRIEGTLKIGGQPGVGKDILFNLTVPGANSDFNGYKATTDDQGQFTMEQVPPGDGEIIRLVKTSQNSWTWSDRTAVTVKSGETTQVSLGDHGAVVIGNMRYDNPPTNDTALNFVGNLSMPMPQQPAFNSPAEAQAYYKSPEWQAQMKLRKSYTLEIKPDGSFDTDDVAPGDYTLNISVRMGGQNMWQHPPLAQGSLPVTVPDSFDLASPINVGEVVLQPMPQPSAPPQ